MSPWAEHLPTPKSLVHYFNRGEMSANERKVQRGVLSPDFDIRETDSHYFLEAELPGLEDKSAINMEWTSSRTLVVEGQMERPKLAAMWKEHAQDGGALHRCPKCDDEAKDDKDHEREHDHTSEDGSKFLLDERKIGPYRRAFSFPVDVDQSAMRAKLRVGLLEIKIPKQPQDRTVRKRVRIE
ncbi:MAG: hypothetical protein M1838_004510 [Thelocarpon superellum]|nr:MAG: hypothetical protein M1838_004510 [Thelocarpon superellum]